MFKKYNLWRRRRDFNKAYLILRREYEYHLAANHLVTFESPNEANLMLRCTACPNHRPGKK